MVKLISAILSVLFILIPVLLGGCDEMPEEKDGVVIDNTGDQNVEVISDVTQEKQYYTSAVGMWYTVWWDAEGGRYYSHWTDWSRTKPVEDGFYSSGDLAKLEKDFKYFKKIGIDFLILDDTNGHGNDGGNIARSIDRCFETAKKLGETLSPKLCIAGGAPLWASNNPGVMQQEMDVFYDYYRFSNGMYFVWKDKPLYISYTSKEYFTWNDRDDRFTIRRAIGRVTEGYKHLPDPSGGLWGWVYDAQMPESEVMGVMPGWDTKHLGRGTRPISRSKGERYTKMWLEAIKRNPEAISIVSWNDHAEETGIEAVNMVVAIPEREGEDPYLYQKITEGYLALRTGLLDNWYYRAESSSDIYQYVEGRLVPVNQAPDREVVIIVPDDYYDWAGLKIG